MRRIGFGSKRLAGADTTGGADVQDRAIALLRRVVELGINHVDTAAFYPSHADDRGPTSFESLDWANDVIHRALGPYPEGLVIATKVGPTRHGLARPDELPGLVEADLRALGVDSLELVYLRQMRLDSIAEHFGVLAELQQKGMIRQLGISNVRLPHLREALEIAPVVAVQNRYSVGFGRVNDEILEVCGELGIAFVPFFAVTAESREAGGVPHSGVVQQIAARHDATEAQVRLAWTLSRGPHVLAIPGTSSVRHLEQNLAAGDLTLTPEDLAALDSLTD